MYSIGIKMAEVSMPGGEVSRGNECMHSKGDGRRVYMVGGKPTQRVQW
jgi:hypothetical protein